jgi:hypothetical protein
MSGWFKMFVWVKMVVFVCPESVNKLNFIMLHDIVF